MKEWLVRSLRPMSLSLPRLRVVSLCAALLSPYVSLVAYGVV